MVVNARPSVAPKRTLGIGTRINRPGHVTAFSFLLSGLGSEYASRGSRKQQIYVLLSIDKWTSGIQSAYKRGLAEGKLEAAALQSRPVVVVTYHKDTDTMKHKPALAIIAILGSISLFT